MNCSKKSLSDLAGRQCVDKVHRKSFCFSLLGSKKVETRHRLGSLVLARDFLLGNSGRKIKFFKIMKIKINEIGKFEFTFKLLKFVGKTG